MTHHDRAELLREIEHALMGMYQNGEWRGDIRQLLTRCRSALRAEAEDAKRYRWLRSECISPLETESPGELVEHCWVDAKIATEADVDAIFDAALQQDASHD